MRIIVSMLSSLVIIMQFLLPTAYASTLDKIGEDPQNLIVGIDESMDKFDQNEFKDNSVATVASPENLILYAVDTLLKLIGVIAVLFIVYGGYFYITARGDEGQTEKGKKIIITAVIGLLLVIASYTIVATILNFGAFQTSPTPTPPTP